MAKGKRVLVELKDLQASYARARDDVRKREREVAKLKKQLAALQDPELPKILSAALDETAGKIAANMQRFGISGPDTLFPLSGSFNAPYGEYLDPVEVTLAKLRGLVS